MKTVNIDYLPFEKALVLEGHTGDETVQNELEQLGSSMKGIMNRLDKMEVNNDIALFTIWGRGSSRKGPAFHLKSLQ